MGKNLLLSSSNLPHGPLYDPESAVLKFKFDEDWENIRLNILGTGALYSDPNFLYRLENDMEWRRPKEICDRPYFINDKPSRFDAIQGHFGDWWLMAGMIALTLHEKLIAHVVPSNQSFDHDYIGAFHFRIWQLGTWYDVIVDDRLPVFKSNKRLVYAHSLRGDVFWAPLLEKAYAKVCGFTYASIIDATPNMAFQDFSGGIVQTVSLNALPADTTVKWFISRVFADDAFICCSCFKVIDQKRDGLLKTLDYTITNVFKCSDDDPDYPGLFLIRLMNPQGQLEWRGEWSDDSRRWREIDRKIREKLNITSREDGEFWMDDRDFVKNFEKISICYLGPGQYLESRRKVNVGTWRTTTFQGEWRAPINAGGSSLSSRHRNSQYKIVLNRPENDSNRDGLCLVVIELTQRARLEKRIFKASIGCYIYSLTHASNPPLPLDYDFFQKHKALNEADLKFSEKGRGFVVSMKLEPGNYCIVPCTQEPNKDQQFLLRVYSESRVEMWEYDTQISRSFPEEDENLSGADHELQALFYNASDGQDEINWIGLQEMLLKTMNPHKTSSIIGSFIKCIRDVMETIRHRSPSDDFVTSKIVFSKDDCRSMIAMLDDNHSGKLSLSEFSSLWNKIIFWCRVYRENCEGYMPVSQLRDALSSIGYNVNTRLINTMIHLYEDEDETITLVDFVLCGVLLESTMSHYQRKNIDRGSKIIFNLEEWVKQTLFL